MGGLTLSQGRLFGAVYESMLFGIHFVLFISMLYLLGKQKHLSLSQKIRCGIMCFIFVLCAVHLAAVMRGLQLAFFESKSSDIFYNDHTQPVDLIQKSAYATATVLADGLLIHRLYVIFSHNWKVTILPCMSLLATTGLWIALIRTYKLSKPGSTLYFPAILRLAPTAFVTSLFTNIIITIMIFVRIKLAMRSIRHLNSSTVFYRRWLAYTVESGLLYPTANLLTCIFYAFKNNGLEILSGSNTQIFGIVPILLTIQIRLDLSIYDFAVKRRATTFGPVSTLQFGSKHNPSIPASVPLDFNTELISGTSDVRHDGELEYKRTRSGWEASKDQGTSASTLA